MVYTQAFALDGLYKKTIISSFHGMWSFAGLIAASIGTFLIGKGFHVQSHFLLIALVSLISFIICSPYLLLEQKPADDQKRPFFIKPEKSFLSLGIIAFCSMMSQGAMFNWSGEYFKKVVMTAPAYLGLGYTAFMISMAATRFITDWLTQRIPLKKNIAGCSIFTTVGLLLTVFFPYLYSVTIGLLFTGIGVSPVVPLVFSAAGKSKTLPPAIAIAAVSTIGFIGLLIDPPMIGFIAGVTSLKISFLILSFLGAVIICIGIFMKKQY